MSLRYRTTRTPEIPFLPHALRRMERAISEFIRPLFSYDALRSLLTRFCWPRQRLRDYPEIGRSWCTAKGGNSGEEAYSGKRAQDPQEEVLLAAANISTRAGAVLTPSPFSRSHRQGRASIISKSSQSIFIFVKVVREIYMNVSDSFT